jgi:hypothetical protein
MYFSFRCPTAQSDLRHRVTQMPSYRTVPCRPCSAPDLHCAPSKAGPLEARAESLTGKCLTNAVYKLTIFKVRHQQIERQHEQTVEHAIASGHIRCAALHHSGASACRRSPGLCWLSRSYSDYPSSWVGAMVCSPCWRSSRRCLPSPSTWLLRRFSPTTAGRPFASAWLRTPLLGWTLILGVLVAAPFYYLMVVTDTRPATVPQVALTNGSKRVVFQGMQHIGSEHFYKAVIYDVEKALSEGYVSLLRRRSDTHAGIEGLLREAVAGTRGRQRPERNLQVDR